jgi:prepilin-type N-terminal cleavage/methylation domain-containing protein
MVEHAPNTAVSGFTLIEVAVAMAVFAILLTGVLSGVTAAVVAANRSRDLGTATWLAVERLEQLRSLTWGFDASSAPIAISDTSTDLSPAAPTGGGAGLSGSPSASLASSTPGFVDYQDLRGAWIGSGSVPPAAAAFERRWRVSRLSGAVDSVVLEVAVGRVGPGRPMQPDVRLFSVKSRKGS